jgi:hypothetical protein
MGTVIDFNRPDAVSTAGGDLVVQTTALVRQLQTADAIATVGDLERAVVERQQIGQAIKTDEAFFEPLKRMAHQLHAALCTREKTILTPLRQLDDDKRRAMSVFKTAQDRIRRQAEQDAADVQRRQREADAVVEGTYLERAGEHAMAEAVVDEAIAAPLPVVALPDVVKTVPALKFRKTWKWRYVNGEKGRALQLLPREFLTVDETKLNAYAARHQDSAVLPGIEFYCEDLPVR